MRKKPIIILGAGFAGIGAADRLQLSQTSYLLIEKQNAPGGLARTDQIGDYFFDRAGHFLHTRSKHFDRRVNECGVRLMEHRRRSAVLIGGSIVPYPLQFNLWAAPKEIASGVRRELDKLSETLDAELSLEETLKLTWGSTLTDRFFRPHLKKMWQLPLNQLPNDWAAEYIPRQNLELLKKGLREPLTDYGYNDTFSYPASGRMGDLADGLSKPHMECLKLETEASTINLQSHDIVLVDGECLPFSRLISTIPLPHLLHMLQHHVDSELFTYSNIINLRIGIRGALLRNEHWYYVPDPDACFFRVGFPSNVTDGVAPTGCCSLSLEYGIGTKTTLHVDPREMAVRALNFLASYGIVTWESIEVVDAHLIAPGYVAHRMSTTPRLQWIAENLARQGILLAGRFGCWDYLSMEQAYLCGWMAGQQLATD